MAVDTTVQVTMPQMGDSVSEGTVLEWHKKEGDQVSEDEVLVEISTDKVDAEVPSPATGTILKIHVAEGDTISVGAVLAEITPNGSAPATAEPAAAEPAATDEEPSGETVDVVMPAMGESVTEGTILEWAKQPGDAVAQDETIVEVSTDKVDAEIPAPTAGTLAEILAQAGDTVHVGDVLARMTAGNGAGPAPPKAPEPAAEPEPPGSASAQVPDGVKVTPVAARVAAVRGVDLATVHGSGPAGRISKADVLAAENGAAAPVPAEAKPIKGASAMLAKYMDESRSVPTATSFRTLTVSVLDGRRKQLKEAGQRVSFTHLIAYAIARAATEQMPVMARVFQDIDGKPHVIDAGKVNLGIAVDVERKDGGRTLMVPVIRDAGRLSFSEFLAAFNDLIARARDNTLTADDLQGANVSLTNPGGIGTIASVPRLMKGQGTIVATGAIGYPPGLAAVGAAIGAEKVMTMTSTYDHRIIQGAESGQFLQVVDQYLQGEHEFYEQVFADLSATLGPAPAAPAPRAAAATSVVPAPAEAAPAPAAAPSEAPSEQLLQAVQAATSLVKAHRTHGHLAARLDPLGSEPEGDPALDPEPLGLTPEIMQLIPAKILRTYVPGATLADALPHLRETYCGTIAYEIEHIASHRQRMWLREKIESGAFRAPLSDEEKRKLLRRLTQVDSLERFMHKAYLGQKQFSIEGLDTTVPMLDEMIQLSAAHGAREVVLGMAHRGRLNVLAHNLGRAYETIFREFEGASSIEAVTTIPQGGTGDVKYHHGAQGTYRLENDGSIIVRLESNPSHLEYVSPVVEGATRAIQTSRQGPHAHLDTNAAIPIILHGDAALPGQGVVSETLNLQALDGYTVGGTLHLIQNNQVGFTTDPDDSRSTRWASDIAKGFDVPIIHVNADDVEACISAVRLAFAFRQEFGHDVMIDLIGYRRFGHNETDEPAYTQPEMAAIIKNKTAGARAVRRPARRAGRDDAGGDRRARDRDLGHAGAPPPRAQRGARRGRRRSSRPAATSSTARPRRRSRPRSHADILQALNDDLLRVPGGLHRPSEAGQAARAPARGGRRRRRHRLGAGRGARVRLAARARARRCASPARTSSAARSRSATSCCTTPRPASGCRRSRACPGAKAPMELHNSPLSRDRVPRLRVRLLDGGARDARGVGGPVRRLRQLGAGDHRPVHRVGAVQVGADDAPDAAAPARLRGLRARAFLGAAGAVPDPRRRGQHPRREPDDAGAVLPPPPPPGARGQAAPAGDHDPEVAAAPAAGDVADRAPVGVALLPGAERAADRRGEGHPARALHRQDLLRPQGPRDAREQRGRRDLARRAAVSVPAAADPRRGRALPEPARGRVGAGGAAQHGRARPHVTAAAAHPALDARVRLRRPARARIDRRGLPGRAHRRADPHHPHRARPRPAGVREPGEAAGRALALQAG